MNIGIAILDMDGTILSKRSIDVFCEELGLKQRLIGIDKLSSSIPAYEVSEMIAKFFTGLPMNTLEKLFDSIPLNQGADEFINFLKTNHFLVAIATDSYEFLAERLSRRISADVVYGNIMEIRDETLTGKLLTDRRCLKIEGCREYSICKLWFMRKLKEKFGGFTVAVGDGQSDLCMIKEADIGIAYRPKNYSITRVAKIVSSSFQDIKFLLQKKIEALQR